MNWQQVCAQPALQNLPFKIELNERGQILMSPVKINHSAYQSEIGYLIRVRQSNGQALAECAIATRLGTKVADVAWASAERFKKMKGKTESPISPEICVEVLSGSNTDAEIEEKRQLYFDQGALEVWICDLNGNMRFYDLDGKLKNSKLFADFPKKIKI